MTSAKGTAENTSLDKVKNLLSETIYKVTAQKQCSKSLQWKMSELTYNVNRHWNCYTH